MVRIKKNYENNKYLLIITFDDGFEYMLKTKLKENLLKVYNFIFKNMVHNAYIDRKEEI